VLLECAVILGVVALLVVALLGWGVTNATAAGPVPMTDASAAANRGPLAERLPSGGARPYVPPKDTHGKPARVPGGGFRDVNDNVWKWDPSGHGGPHWDVQHKDGRYTNVAPDGTVIGKDDFPNKALAPAGGAGAQSGMQNVGGAAAMAGTIGTILWWVGKGASPACGPFAPVCVAVL